MDMMIFFLISLWFVALVSVGYTLTQEIRIRQLRKRAIRLMRAQAVAEERAIAMTDEALRLPLPFRLFQMLLFPVLRALSRRLPDSGTTMKALDRLLAMAGYPMGLTAKELMGLRVLLTLIGLALGVVIPLLLSPWVPGVGSSAGLVFFLTLFLVLGFLGPVFWVRRVAQRRRNLIRRQLPDMLDLITLSVEAGLGFDGAVTEAARRMKGPLAEELLRTMREVSLGKSRAQALRDMAERVKLEDLSLLVSVVHQAETLGAPMAEALKTLASELRKKRLRLLREQIARLPVKLVFPLVLFIFPTMFIVTLGPAFIALREMGFWGGAP